MLGSHGLVDVKGQEQEDIQRCLSHHPILMIRGPEQTGVIRSVESVMGLYFSPGVDQDEQGMVWDGSHPDVFLYDGRELTAEDARQLRQAATSFPAKWDRRFAVISYIDRPHFTVLPILLKLIEEPPDHFSIILTTSNEHRVLPTIMSRALQVRVRPSDESEIGWWIHRHGKESDRLRVKACGGDPDIAVKLDLAVLKAWHRDWSGVVLGSDFPGSFPAVWSTRLEEASEATQAACWETLIQVATKELHRSRLWSDVALIAIEARNAVQNGWMNKMLSSTFLFKVYALAKTIITRVKR